MRYDASSPISYLKQEVVLCVCHDCLLSRVDLRLSLSLCVLLIVCDCIATELVSREMRILHPPALTETWIKASSSSTSSRVSEVTAAAPPSVS